MKMKLLFSLGGCLVSACSIREQEFDSSQIVEAEAAINFCIKSYKELAGSDIDPRIDRVYVLKDPGQMDILFTRGEIGMFGERAGNYASFAACGILRDEDMQLYFLGGEFPETFLEKEGVSQIPYKLHGQEIWDLFFLKEGGSFKFIDKRNFYDELNELENRESSKPLGKESYVN